MIPSILWILRHFSPNLLESSTIKMKLIQQLSKPIITTLHFPQQMRRGLMTTLLIHVGYIVNIVHVCNKSSHPFWNLGLGIDREVNHPRYQLANCLQLTTNSLKILFVTHFFVFFFLSIPLPASAWLNSFATPCGTPTFFANAG